MKFNKRQKKMLLAAILIFLAIIQIFNFARWNIYIRPIIDLNFHDRGIIAVLFSLLNWPFKSFNYLLVFLLGWAALLTPLFLLTLAFSFITSKRETDKVKRQRVIMLWGLAEISFLVYVINFTTRFVVNPSVRPGYIAEIFGRYLGKIGGFSLIPLFFIWSLIAFIIYLRRSTWKAFFKEGSLRFKTILKGTAEMMAKRADAQVAKSKRLTAQKEPEKLEYDKKKPERESKEKKKIDNKVPDTPKKPEKPKEEAFVTDEEEDESTLETETMPLTAESKKPKSGSRRIIDVDYETVVIKEFDTTQQELAFKYEALTNNVEHEIDTESVEELAGRIEESFSELGIVLKRRGVTAGPRLLRFEYDFPKGIQLKEIEKKQEEISYRLGGINLDIELPIPGTNKFGIYIGRDKPDMLGLGSYLQEIDSREESVPLLLGVSADGRGIWADAVTFPHLLIGGTTGSGKSVFLNNIILNLMAISVKQPINIILIDPKRVEFTPYKEISQLSHPIITDVDEAQAILGEAEQLMDERYERVTAVSVRNIFEYNEQQEEKMPFLFIIIDEFSDLVMQDKSGQIKKSIIRLAQKSRAVGIHVIIATQRPSSDVIDGLIKANFPARITFKTSSKVDSRIILDENGAENLLGKGDMIVKTGADNRQRLQGIYIGIDEIKEVSVMDREADDE